MSRIQFLFHVMVAMLLCFVGQQANAQQPPTDSLKVDSLRIKEGVAPRPVENIYTQYDVGDLIRNVLHPKKKTDSLHKKSGITIIPNIAANPTIGFQLGIKAVAGLKLGRDPKTLMSVAASSASATTKGILYFYISHNVFTNRNKYNLQGSLVAARSVIPDFGLGIGHEAGSTEEDKILTNGSRKGHVLRSEYYNFREKVYKEMLPNFFVGAGVSFEIRRNIEDRTHNELTPYNIYSDRYGFARDHYQSNGLLFNAEYTSRDNQNRAYKGIFADVGIRLNQEWLGSSKNATMLTTDFRKYFSLSHSHPEHVIALWNWGSYIISGAMPYFELPGTARDPGSRSGRGYTYSYFRGTQYNYSEVEYRFPITRNKFLSGVTFFHLQTANNDLGTKLFEQWQPGGGLGLRILFNKATRTNLCLDYAWGKYGAKGFFLGLNEAF